MDRGSLRELLRHVAGATPDSRRGDGPGPGRPDSRHPGRLLPRHRGLRSLRPDGPDQFAMHVAGHLQRAELLLRIHRCLHQQGFRDPAARGGPAARRLCHGTSPGPRRPGAGSGSGGNSAAKPAAPGRLPARPPHHLPGFRPARVRQRQLRAGPRQGAADDRLGAVPSRRTAAATGGRETRGDRPRHIRRGNRDRAVRGGPGADPGKRQGLGGDRCRDAGPEPFYHARPGGRRATGRGGGGRRSDYRRHGSFPLGHGHFRQPRRRGGGQRRARRRAGGAGKGPEGRREKTRRESGGRGTGGRMRAGPDRSGTVGNPGRVGGGGQSVARSGPARQRTRPGGDPLLRPGARRDGMRRARHDR